MTDENPPDAPTDESQRQSERERTSAVEQHVGSPLRDLSSQIEASRDDANTNSEKTQREQKQYQDYFLTWNKRGTIAAIVFSFITAILSFFTLWVVSRQATIMKAQTDISREQSKEMKSGG